MVSLHPIPHDLDDRRAGSANCQYRLCSVYTFAVYMGSSIYTPGEEAVMKEFSVGTAASRLGMALYVLACETISWISAKFDKADTLDSDGIGTLLFSPLSEYALPLETSEGLLTRYAGFLPSAVRVSRHLVQLSKTL